MRSPVPASARTGGGWLAQLRSERASERTHIWRAINLMAFVCSQASVRVALKCIIIIRLVAVSLSWSSASSAPFGVFTVANCRRAVSTHQLLIVTMASAGCDDSAEHGANYANWTDYKRLQSNWCSIALCGNCFALSIRDWWISSGYFFS